MMLSRRSLSAPLGKLSRTAAALSLGLFMLSSKAAPAWSQSRTTITFWHAMRGDKEATLKEIIADFERANPSVKVNPQFIGSSNAQWGSDYNALYRQILESLATHTPPDVSQVYENWTTQLIDYGYVVPVEDYFATGKAFTRKDLDDLVPVFRTANTYSNKVWTLPFNKSIYVLYYNADTLRSKKVAVPATWDQLRGAARRLTPDDRSTYGFIVQPNVDSLGHVLYSGGGDFVSGDKVAFNQAPGKAALSYWVDMVNTDRTAFQTFDPGNGFAEGKGQMYVYTTSSYSYLQKKAHFKVGIAPLPSTPGCKQQVQIAGTNLAIFKTNPERQEASYKFISYLCSSGVNSRWALRTGYLPVRRSSIASAEYQGFLRSHPDYQTAALERLKFARVQPKVSAWESIRGIVDDAMFEAISRRLEPREALDRAASIASDLVRKILGGAQR